MSLEFNDLNDFNNEIIKLAGEIYPQEVKKMLKDCASKLAKKTKNKAKREVGKKSGNYLKGFKKGRVYKYKADNSDCCRIYNSQPHAHFIEYGHIQKNENGQTLGFTAGKHIFKKIENEFEKEFSSDIEDFIKRILDKGLKN